MRHEDGARPDGPPPPKLSRYGFWSMASEGRTDFAMLMGLLFLLIVGAGPWSLDAMRSRDASSP